MTANIKSQKHIHKIVKRPIQESLALEKKSEKINQKKKSDLMNKKEKEFQNILMDFLYVLLPNNLQNNTLLKLL